MQVSEEQIEAALKAISGASNIAYNLKQVKPPHDAQQLFARISEALDGALPVVRKALQAAASVPPDSGKPVAWIVGRADRNGQTQLCLPLLRSREEMERYQRNNPDERLVALYAHPSKSYEDGVREDAAELLGRYADFIRNHVKADDIEMHPYLPELERVILALLPSTGAGND